MTHCSIGLRDRRSVTRYELLSSAKSIGKELIKKYIYSKFWEIYSQNFLIMLKNLLQMHWKLRKKRVTQKTVEAIDDLVVNKIANKTTKKLPPPLKKMPPSKNKKKEKILKGKYRSPEKIQKIIDELKLIS